MLEIFKDLLNFGGIIREVLNVEGKIIKDLNTKVINSLLIYSQNCLRQKEVSTLLSIYISELTIN
jgi:hypothetical protein